MSHLLALALVFFNTPGDDIVKSAEQIRKLDDFMESYIGECAKGDADDKKSCQETAAAFRQKVAGKTFVTDLSTDFLRNLRPATSKDPRVLIYDFTPFFDAGGNGVTFAKPIGQDKSGDPKIKSSQLNIPLDENGESAILGGMKVDRVSAVLVFKPGEIWKLPKPKPKGAFYYGVAVKPVLLRVTEARSGENADTIYK